MFTLQRDHHGQLLDNLYSQKHHNAKAIVLFSPISAPVFSQPIRLASLKHPYIVRYHESFVEHGTLAIVMDYSDRQRANVGELKHYLTGPPVVSQDVLP